MNTKKRYMTGPSRQAPCLLIKQSSFTKDDNGSDNDDMHEVDWDDDSEMMAAAVLVVVNNNVAIMKMMLLTTW